MVKEPLGVSNGDGTITLTNSGLDWICSFIKKGETLTEDQLLQRINKKLKKRISKFSHRING